ncbi:SHOCT domain-containing protein [Ruminococcus sp. AM43-6]|nr:SHOCT domain-containing protein [Ruminococcus sp. AM43-6]
MDKIDNIMVTENLINKMDGGKTVAIRSASGLIKFPWVQNADEFVNATLAEIEKYNQSLKNVDQNLVSAISGNSVQKAQPEKSAAQKIKDLKELLDSGLITQDEFDAKKKDLLDKM